MAEKIKQSAEKRFNEAFIQEVIEAVQANNAPWQKSWKTGEINVPFNAASRRIYSGRNVLRLAIKAHKEGHADPRWGTFRQITEMGGKVKKGEKGTGILFFQETEAQREDGTPYTKKTVRHFTVFNLAQTDLPVYQQTDKKEANPDLQPFAEILKRHQPNIQVGEPAYRVTTDTISMPPKSSFSHDAYYYSTVLHEMAHWTGHESRLNRNLNNKFGSPDYAQEKVIAELSSYMLSLETGLPFNPSQSESYLKHWGEKTGKELEDSLMTAFKNASAVQVYLSGDSREQVIDKKVSHYQQTEPQPLHESLETNQHFFSEVMWSSIEVETAKQAIGFKEKVYLAVPYDKREVAKNAGAKWDKSNKSWYAYDVGQNASLKQFLPDFSAVQGGQTVEDFRTAATQIGLDMSTASLETGKRFRVALQGRSGQKDGEYKVFTNGDGTIGGYAINYASGEKITWSNRSNTKLPLEIYAANIASQNQSATLNNRVNTYIAEQRAQLANQAYEALPPAKGDEPYLSKKGIKNTHGLRRLDDDTIVVPLIDGHRITSLQTIAPNGDKRMMKQANKQGSYFPMGNRKSPSHIFLAEGVATAETVFQVANHKFGDQVLVIAAIDANNLMATAEKITELYPHANHYIAADHDLKNVAKDGKNTGVEAAQRVADKFEKFSILIPVAKTPEHLSQGLDWNDFYMKHGLGAVTTELLSQVTTAMTKNKHEDKSVSLIPLAGLSPREAGRKLYDATQGDLRQLDLIKRSVKAVNLAIDSTKLQAANGKSSIEKANIFMHSVSFQGKEKSKPQRQQFNNQR